MDSFAELDFLFCDSFLPILEQPSAQVHEEDDTMRQLSDSDSMVNSYGGYCIVS